MKGLLRKDCYMTVAYCRALLLVAVVFMVVSIFSNGSLFFIMFPGMYLSMIGTSLYAMDESQGWLKYSLTLPYGRDLIVTERYVFSLLMALVGCATFLVTQLLHILVDPTFTLASILELLPLYLTSTMVTPIISLPCMFRFGAEKGRLVYLFTVGFTTAFLFPISSMAEAEPQSFTFSGFLWIILLVLPVVFFFSWYLSLRFFRKREL